MWRRPFRKFLAILLTVIVFQIISGGTTFAQIALDDALLTSATGQPVTVNVLTNDVANGTWVPTSVRIIDPSDFVTQLTEYVEPDQGVWTATVDGTITFVPCTAAGTPDIRCTATLDGDPFQIEYVVQDETGISNPAQVMVTFAESPLSVTVAYFTSWQLSDGQVEFQWVTVTESGNAGFNLLVLGESGLTPINASLLPSNIVDSVEPQLYGYVSSVLKGTVFYLQEMATNGGQSNSGPFELSQEYGSLPHGLNNGSVDETPHIYLPFISTGS